MSRRWRNSAALVWAVWWFAFFAPMHQRGAVRVAGPDPLARPAAGQSCCAADASAPTRTNPATPPEGSRRCAVCYLVAALSVPPIITFDIPTLGLLTVLPATAMTDQVPSVDHGLRPRSRAPPPHA